ncbi:MAG: SUMF1/EgtB/PvdO family nonheme iron enzyme, partial [Phycisphaerales bacterium]|nr:SUMF1/EgtB/PvdO family nonheme iron enzyme [Phycisphaerales bacterium]
MGEQCRNMTVSVGRTRWAMAVGVGAAAWWASAGLADIDPATGIDFVRIGAVGNAPYHDPTPNSFVNGRGGVSYEYSIGRFEVTTEQWVRFFNAAFDRPVNDRIPHLVVPDHWGAAATAPTTPGGRRWTVPAGNAMLPVSDISWRMAAIYCNWLHNGQSTDRAAFMSGAYDVTTFGFESGVPNLRFTDQREHSPGARYWIPTWDEWLKSAHYDPDKVNQDGSVG